MGDLNSRRGRVLGMEQSERTGISVVKAQVPLAEMSDYVTALRSITQGQGVFNRQFYTYEEVPHKQAEEDVYKRQFLSSVIYGKLGGPNGKGNQRTRDNTI